MRCLRLVELLGAPNRVDGEELAFGSGGGQELAALLVVVKRPDVFGAFRDAEAFHRAGLGLDAIDASIGQRPCIESAISPERQRRHEQLTGVGELFDLLAFDLEHRATGPRADVRLVAAARDAVGKGDVFEANPFGGRAQANRAIGANGGSLELTLEEVVGAVEHEALGGHRGHRGAGDERDRTERDGKSRS